MTERLYSRGELFDLERKVLVLVERELEHVLSLEGPARAAEVSAGMWPRLRDAGEWLRMMQECVKTDDRIIALTDDVNVTLYDAFLIP